jgi:hypothetical protein
MNAVENYLRNLGDVHASGAATPELSLYPPLANLLNAVGRTVNPNVRCVMSLKNIGSGLPDGGLFSSDQFFRSAESQPSDPLHPSRGAIEAKAPSEDILQTARSLQVGRYLTAHGQVLVTNFWAFALVSRDASGKPTILEVYKLADTEADFWVALRNPHQLAQQEGQRLSDYLKRVMLHAAPLVRPHT